MISPNSSTVILVADGSKIAVTTPLASDPRQRFGDSHSAGRALGRVVADHVDDLVVSGCVLGRLLLIAILRLV
ncbi:hypothetical protein GS452_28150 [Rhodococcus hoagii]|nr:hypothetical protein [Prescottella equi]